jgi:hypothetical protein
LEGVATEIDPTFRVIERVYPYVLARLVQDPDPETRLVLRRLILNDDASVRWNRVAGVVAAVAEIADAAHESFETHAAEHATEHAAEHADPSRSARSSGSSRRRRLGTRGDDEGCFVLREALGTDAIPRAWETATAVVEGLGEVAARGYGRRVLSPEDASDPTVSAADAVRDAMEFIASERGARLRRSLVEDALEVVDRFGKTGSEKTAGGAADFRTARDPEGPREMDARVLFAFANAARDAYVRAPRVWAPTIAATLAKREVLEMGAEVSCGVSRRVRAEVETMLRAVEDTL